MQSMRMSNENGSGDAALLLGVARAARSRRAINVDRVGIMKQVVPWK